MLMFFVGLAGVISFFVSSWLIQRVDKFGLVDLPNTRSSHTKPTPKGGGVGIVLGILVALGGCYLMGFMGREAKYSTVILASLAMALLGFASDRFQLSALIRFTIQIGIAGITVLFLGEVPFLEIGRYNLHLGFLGIPLAMIWLVGLTNFYNFMDGIDGLAAMQGIIAGIAIAFFGIILHQAALIPLGLVLSGATLGFLFLNISPAKIFMGDVGSYQAGFYIAAIGLLDQRLFVPVAIILSVFVFDTVVTLIRRILKGERWYQAHKSHFYQRAVQLGYTHSQVTGALSMVFILLAILACLYVLGDRYIRIATLSITFMGLVSMATWVVSKERLYSYH